MRRVALTVLVVLLAGACGGGDDDGTTSDKGPTETTAVELSADDQEYADAIAAALRASDEKPEGVTEDDIRCYAEGIAGSVGADTFVAAGIAVDDITPDDDPIDTLEGQLDETQALGVADAFVTCLDFGQVFAAQVTSSDEGIDGACLGETLQASDSLRDVLARILTGESEGFSFTSAEAEVIAPDLVECIDFAQVIAAEADLEAIDAECFAGVFEDDDAFTRAFAKQLVDSESEFTIDPGDATRLAEASADCLSVVAVAEGNGLVLDDEQAECVEAEWEALDPDPFVELFSAVYRRDDDATRTASTAGRQTTQEILSKCGVEQEQS